MGSYQFRFLDETGAAAGGTTQLCLDDLTALEAAIGMSDGHAVEIWEGRYRVALVKKDHAPLDVQDPASL